MAYIRETAGGLMGVVPLGWLHKMAHTKLIVPLYHTISDLPLPHIQPLYPVRSTEQFKTDIRWLLHKYQPVTLRQLTAQAHAGEPFSKPSFHLTFDDGLRQVLPLSKWLKEQGISATMFVNPSFMGNQGLMHRFQVALLITRLEDENDAHLRINLANALECGKEEVEKQLLRLTINDRELLSRCLDIAAVDVHQFLETERPYLDPSELQTWLDDGHSLGGHSMDHPEYYLLSPEEQWTQAWESCDWIREHFAIDPVPFAFPFTDWKVAPAFFQRWQEETDGALIFGTRGVHAGTIPQHVQRIPVERTAHGIPAIVKGALLARILKPARK
jgi:peptidoglycan/xylan/chitin deacetylase (PgdA/CDA1 family)